MGGETGEEKGGGAKGGEGVAAGGGGGGGRRHTPARPPGPGPRVGRVICTTTKRTNKIEETKLGNLLELG